VHVALGEMQARLGREESANSHLALALKLALAELERPPRQETG